jgi:mRNA interferase RelE/StbE
VYNVFYTGAAAHQLRRLPHDATARIREAIEALTTNPRTPHTEKLEGYPNAYRFRVGSYRVLYTIDDPGRRVTIYRIAHRREAYR